MCLLWSTLFTYLPSLLLMSHDISMRAHLVTLLCSSNDLDFGLDRSYSSRSCLEA
jgi:hypothetical protein